MRHLTQAGAWRIHDCDDSLLGESLQQIGQDFLGFATVELDILDVCVREERIEWHNLRGNHVQRLTVQITVEFGIIYGVLDDLDSNYQFGALKSRTMIGTIPGNNF